MSRFILIRLFPQHQRSFPSDRNRRIGANARGREGLANKRKNNHQFTGASF